MIKTEEGPPVESEEVDGQKVTQSHIPIPPAEEPILDPPRPESPSPSSLETLSAAGEGVEEYPGSVWQEYSEPDPGSDDPVDGREQAWQDVRSSFAPREAVLSWLASR